MMMMSVCWREWAANRNCAEMPSFIITRARRCIWLGLRIADLGRWITFDAKAGEFASMDYARDLEFSSKQHIPADLDVLACGSKL
ncbi:hypothetical protein VTN31DRAFT_4912 [Thermomyces dupontii]|uniref:uncharacterized protein n=1 Tax=Talaromyces thermophilus TaxID=28565 RepID=UPI0037423D9D